MKLIGQGAKAELHDYSLTLQVVSEPKDINWANEMRFYN
jgi:hypothetical protein